MRKNTMEDKEKMMAYTSFGVAAILLLLAFFGPGWKTVEEMKQSGATSGEGASGSVVHALPKSPAQFAARAKLAKDIGIEENAIAIVDATPTEWSDACLGLAREGELCAQAITPGERVRLSANNVEYVFHVNLEGTSIRRAQ